MTAAARRGRRTGTKSDRVDALEIARITTRDHDLPAPRFAGAPESLACVATTAVISSQTAPPPSTACMRTWRRSAADTTPAPARSPAAAASTLRPGCCATTPAPSRDRQTPRHPDTAPQPRDRRAEQTDRPSRRRHAHQPHGHLRHRSARRRGHPHRDRQPRPLRNQDPLRDSQRHRPLEASSGRVARHRLNRSGNRQLNKALHTAAIAQICGPRTEGHAYYQRCLDRGKTKREAIRALKRRI